MRMHIALLAALTATACKTTVPATDVTPPEVTLRYYVGDGTWTEVTTDTVLEVPFTGTLHLWGLGHDAGGVQSVRVDAAGTLTCGSAGGMSGRLGYVDVHETASESAGVGIGDATEASRSVYAEVDLGGICGDDAPGGGFAVSATALDFHGGETKSPVLRVQPD